MTSLTLTAGGKTIDFGVVTSFIDSFSKSVMTTPIVSLTADSTFALETGASMTYTAGFSRVSPEPPQDSGDDPCKWSNGKWASALDLFVNRWQIKTNGAHMKYDPGDDLGRNMHVPCIEKNVFISSLSLTYSEGYTDYLTGSITMTVGSSTADFSDFQDNAMKARMFRSDVRTSAVGSSIQNQMEGAGRISVKDEDSYITLSNSDRSKTYLLKYSQVGDDGTIIDLVDKYEITGGPESPFESVKMTLSRKKMMTMYPELAKAADGSNTSKGLLIGHSIVTIHDVGVGTYIITKCRMSRDQYTLTGYCLAESLKGYTIGSVMRAGTPLNIIKDILSDGSYGVRFDVNEGELITNCTDASGSLILKPDVNVWTALQLCAHALNSKLFFANDKAYLIDYSNAMPPNYFANGLDLYPSADDGMLFNNVIGSAELGSEGADTIINHAAVLSGYDTIEKDDGTVERIRVRKESEDQDSVSVFNVHSCSDTDLDRYIVINDDTRESADRLAEACAGHLTMYRSEPQQSIGFTVKERRINNDVMVWTSFFPMVTTVSSISSCADDIHISNRSSVSPNKIKPQKLYLSRYVRKYPEGVSEYWFGITANVDLAQSTSEIMTVLGR